MLIHEQHPELLHIEILHDRMHVVVDAGCRAQVGPLFWRFHLTTLAQFTSRQDGDGLGFSDAVVLTEFVDTPLAKGIQIVLTVCQNPLHQGNGVFLWRTFSNQYSQ